MFKKLSFAAIASTVVLPAAAVNMAFYQPAADVDAGFGAFLEQ